jgi:hypothetical protein
MRHTSRDGILTAIGALTGMGAILLPFTWDASPANVAIDLGLGSSTELDLPLLLTVVLPFFLAIPVTLAWARYLVAGRLSLAERIAATLLGTVSAAVTSLVLMQWTLEAGLPESARDWTSLLSPFAALIAGVALAIRNRRRDLPPEANALLAMHVAYIANVLLCLFGFPRLQIGAWAAAATMLIYAAQTVAVSGPRTASR